ncbi:MAG: hypothetical protein MJ099_06800 [Clostridia bacterium]|nr:hypothetical protein [Clostridia bacterium]
MAKIMTKREVRRRKMKYRVFAGLYDFVAILAGIAVIIVCCVLLTTLAKWTIATFNVSFEGLLGLFNDALIVPK